MKKLILFTLLFISLSITACRDHEIEYPGDCYPCEHPTDSPSEPDGN